MKVTVYDNVGHLITIFEDIVRTKFCFSNSDIYNITSSMISVGDEVMAVTRVVR